MYVTWQELGRPTSPGWCAVKGVGRVQVTEENIQTAEQVGGQVKFKLIDMTVAQDPGPQYYLGPADTL